VAVQLQRLWGKPAHQLDLVSPYFVPGKEGAQALADLARSGARVRVLTNSLEATDVAAVHAGYAKWRHDLLRAGVSLFELRRSWSADLPDSGRGRFGSSASSLHAKTFGVDSRSIFVGSFNMDQRSLALNTEMGFVIDSPRMAQELSRVLDTRIPERAYEVHLDETGKLFWIERADGKTLRYDAEPGTGVWKRAGCESCPSCPSTGCCRKFGTGLANFIPGSL
jgi:putative cardiolipin synthase